MTFEHRIVVGLEEIKAIVLECNLCHAKIVFAPEKLENQNIPSKGPCGHAWESPQTAEPPLPPLLALITSLKTLRNSNMPGFSVRLEFDEAICNPRANSERTASPKASN
ncbi:MAG TPA: hypothetical protein VG322_04700 [Candidatus Acidoferrales bacterium]|jgi:hypothetical protein|nr:hypothetical protein [Candidatus Acidoferrales bacterium]